MNYVFSPEAELDLHEIVDFIAADNPAAARKLITDLLHACETLAKHPRLGHARKDLTSDSQVLFYCVRTYYLIIYRKGTKPLQIARVLHGARDVAGEFDPHTD